MASPSPVNPETSAAEILPNVPADEIAESPTHEHVARATGIVAMGNITSRILGLFREMILAHLFGATASLAAFKFAIIVPRGLYDLLVGGHVNSALVPVLSDYATRNNREKLWELVNVLLGLVLVVLLSLVLIIELLAPQIILIVAGSGSEQSTIDEATTLLRITAPALIFLSLFAVVSGLLYSLKRFALPAFAGSIFNGTIVLTTIVFADSWGITAAAVGWFFGAIVQLALQFPALRDARLMPRFKGMFTHPGIRGIFLLYLPVMFSLGLDVLINRPFSYNLVASQGDYKVNYMEWATTLMQFPHGLVATAISIAVLPTLSQQAASAKSLGLDNFKNTLGLGLRLATVLILPATIGLFVLANPVIGLIFEHGKFTADDTLITAQALRLYLIGLPFATIDLLLVFAFYAQQDTVTPAIIGVVSLVAYMVTALVLLPYLGFLSLMVADTVKHVVHSSISGYLLWKRVGSLRGQRILGTALRAILTAGLMGILAFGMLMLLLFLFPAKNILTEIIQVVGASGVGIIAYWFIGQRVGLDELQWMVQVVQRKLGRTPSN